VFLPVAYAGISKGEVYKVGKIWITGGHGIWGTAPVSGSYGGLGGESVA